MTTDVPSIRPYATRDEWRRDFHDGASSPDGEPPTLDVWDVLDRETGAFKWEISGPRHPDDWLERGQMAYNRRTGEVVYGRGVQS